MGSITIDFIGICTWIGAPAIKAAGGVLPTDEPGNNVQWRMVLPDGRNGLNYVYVPLLGAPPLPQAIPPHAGVLNIGSATIAAITGQINGAMQSSPSTWNLAGMRMWVNNPDTTAGLVKPQPPQSSDSPDTILQTKAVPSLRQYSSDIGNPSVLALSLAVVTGQQALALFDITYGALTSLAYPNNTYDITFVRYTVPTLGPPEIAFQTFFDGSNAVMTFNGDDVTISLENSAPDGNDTWFDWMLHYLCCTKMPPNAIPPGPNPPVNSHGDGLTAGCSNSQWP